MGFNCCLRKKWKFGDINTSKGGINPEPTTPRPIVAPQGIKPKNPEANLILNILLELCLDKEESLKEGMSLDLNRGVKPDWEKYQKWVDIVNNIKGFKKENAA